MKKYVIFLGSREEALRLYENWLSAQQEKLQWPKPAPDAMKREGNEWVIYATEKRKKRKVSR